MRLGGWIKPRFLFLWRIYLRLFFRDLKKEFRFLGVGLLLGLLSCSARGSGQNSPVNSVGK